MLKPLVMPAMPANVQSILNIGCGNSKIAKELRDEGFSDILSVDIAQTAIDVMSERFKGVSGLRFLQMDVTNMTLEDASFDVVFDKGLLDALRAGAAEKLLKVVPEVFRVLRPGGLFAVLTIDKHGTSLNVTGGPAWGRFVTKMVPKKNGNPMWLYLLTKAA